mgnify:CR=1 FL=1
MKRLLILAYDFPPYVSVGGLRPYAWYKYLKKYGVYPIVITRQWENKYGNELDYIAPSATNETIVEETELGTIIRTPYKPNLANKILLKYGTHKFAFIRKFVSCYYEFAQFFFNVGPKSCIYRGARNYLKIKSVDAIIATGEPFVLFKYASQLSKKYNTPWIADYRDPWTQDNNRSKNWLFQTRNTFAETKYTRNASCITTVSEFFAQKITSLVNKKAFIIANGYDSEAVQSVKHIAQKSDKLRFAYVGTIYKYHPLESVLDCFNQLVLNNALDAFEFNFFGIKDHIGIENLLTEKFQALKPYVTIFPRITNNKLLPLLAEHNVFLLFNDYRIVGTKIYDYLALQRNILFCYANDESALKLKQLYYNNGNNTSCPQEDIITKTKSGIIVQNQAHLATILPQLYKEFSTNGCIACSSVNTTQYSREQQVEKLAELVNHLENI